MRRDAVDKQNSWKLHQGETSQNAGPDDERSCGSFSSHFRPLGRDGQSVSNRIYRNTGWQSTKRQPSSSFQKLYF